MGTLQNHPAESGGVAAALALLVAHFLGLTDVGLVVALGVVIGFVPAAITWTVNLVRGRQGNDGQPPG